MAPRHSKRAIGTATPWRFGAGRQWSDREIEEMYRRYVVDKISAATVARLFKATTSQVYRIARIHDWPHQKGGQRIPNPKAVRNLRPKHREIYYHLRPTLGHAAALAEVWRGREAEAQVEQLERV